jgi:hypothetical protein
MTNRGKGNDMASRGKGPHQSRSPKAGKPPEEAVLPPRLRRRRKTAHVAVRKDTTMFEAGDGPRVVWGVTKPKVKKR